MFVIAYECALRRCEIISINLNDIDHALQTITIRGETSKSRDDRVLPFDAEVSALLIAYERNLPAAVHATERVFRSESRRNKGAPLSSSTWNKLVDRIRERSGVPAFHGHAIRHLALTDLARAGWTIFQIKAFAGHQHIDTTDKYIHLASKDLSEAFARTSGSLREHRSRMLLSLVLS